MTRRRFLRFAGAIGAGATTGAGTPSGKARACARRMRSPSAMARLLLALGAFVAGADEVGADRQESLRQQLALLGRHADEGILASRLAEFAHLVENGMRLLGEKELPDTAVPGMQATLE